MSSSPDARVTASPPSTLSKALQTAVLCPTIVANLLGNICICLAVVRVRSLRKRPTSSILASLAVSDLSMLSFLLFRLIWLYDFEAASKVCEHFLFLVAALSFVSIAHICLLSCDRYVAIICPLRYPEIVSKRRVRGAMAVAWGAPLASFLAVPMIYSNERSALYRTDDLGCSESESKPSLAHQVHVAFNITFFGVLPFMVMIFVYGRIAKVSLFQNNRVEPGENLNPETAELKRKRRKEMKWMKTIVIVIGAFVLCYFPTFICVALTVKLGPSRVPVAVRSTFFLTMAINSALNPVIYAFRSKEFKLAFRKVLRGASVGREMENNTRLRTGVSCVEKPKCGHLNEHLPSSLALPDNKVASREPRLEESSVMTNVGGQNEESQERVGCVHVNVTYGQGAAGESAKECSIMQQNAEKC